MKKYKNYLMKNEKEKETQHPGNCLAYLFVMAYNKSLRFLDITFLYTVSIFLFVSFFMFEDDESSVLFALLNSRVALCWWK